LLVLAFLLVSSFAHDVAIYNFKLLCMRKDGSYAPLSRSEYVFRLQHGSTDRDMYVCNTEQNARFETDDEGRMFILPGDLEEYGTYETIHLWVDLNCATPYAQECPAVNNLCRVKGVPIHHHTIKILYSQGDRKAFFNGFLALITPRDEIRVVRTAQELRCEKMTK
ncbi:hypothetical protein PMAYCL1PPCAC_05168, partial [Pristionchus mayeri]